MVLVVVLRELYELAVSTRKVTRVVSAEEFFDTARKFCKSVTLTLCLKEDISKAAKVLCLVKSALKNPKRLLE